MAMNLSLINRTAELPIDAEANFSDLREDYREILEAQEETGVTVSFRAKLPSSGGKNFSIITGDENTDFDTPEFSGVIVRTERCNARFEDDVLGNPPLCSSMDGINGVEAETGECHKCAVCPYNKYGTASKGSGKACKNMIRLYILVPGIAIPLLLTLPPTSLSAWTNYRINVKTQYRMALNEVSTKFALTNGTSKKGHKYPIVKMSVEGRVADDQREFLEYVSEQLNPKIEITADDYNVVKSEGEA